MAPTETVWTSKLAEVPEQEEVKEVKVILPSGVELTYAELTAEDLENIAADYGMAKFVPKDENGDTLEAGDFPIYDGTVTIVEFNEPKL